MNIKLKGCDINKMALYCDMVKNKNYGNDIWSLCESYMEVNRYQ